MNATVADNTNSANRYWLFSAPVDLSAFLGSALVSLLALAYGAYAGLLDADTPSGAWIPFILLIDVAHVYATGFRVYFDGEELRRRPLLYFGAPLIGFVIGLLLYTESPLLFWRCLAYLAVFHFVRQQYGWVMLYRTKRGEKDRMGKTIDTVAIYLATIYPLVYWHANLPREFWWFLERDFQAIPQSVVTALFPIYCLALLAYLANSILAWRKGEGNPGKDLVMLTTVVCWYVGIVVFNSDYSFTVTNVVIHGVPYFVLIYWYMRQRSAQKSAATGKQLSSPWRTVILLVGAVWMLAFVEEMFWDRTMWRERPWLFGEGWRPEVIGGWQAVIVALLATPQLTHYILDGFIWRRGSNPNFSLFRSQPTTSSTTLEK